MKLVRLLVLVLFGMLAACKQAEAPQFNAVDITGAPYGSGLAMPDAEGRPRTLAEFEGKVVAVFFGFTQCPDVCPSSLALLADVTKRLGPDGERLQTVFVTLDPERDTGAILKEYMAAFNPRFLALRGTPEQTAAVARDFRIHYEKRGDVAGGKYTMDHTAAFFLFDPQSRLRLFVRHGETPERVLADVKLLLEGK